MAPQVVGMGPYGAAVLQEAPGAKAALIWGIASLFCCGIICGPIAISKASSAKEMCDQYPAHYTGGSMATAGKVLGIIGLIIGILNIVGALANLGAN